MKTKVARKIAKSAAKGTLYPIHILRAAAMRLGRPLVVDGDFTYFPKGLKGKFVKVTQYRPVYVRDIVLPVGTDLTAFEGRKGYVREIDLEAGQHRLDPGIGCHVEGVCRWATHIAKVVGARVPFSFNGMELLARPITNPSDLYRFWEIEMERKRLEYLNSDEYKAEQARQLAENQRDQEIIDGLIGTLDESVKDRETLLRWLGSFAAVADNQYMTYPQDAINRTIKAAGYVSKAFVGKREEIEASKQAEAEYIIGQAISCMDSGMPPHPILTEFVKRYFGEATEETVDIDQYEADYVESEESEVEVEA